jgi:hypothetical protein
MNMQELQKQPSLQHDFDMDHPPCMWLLTPSIYMWVAQQAEGP